MSDLFVVIRILHSSGCQKTIILCSRKNMRVFVVSQSVLSETILSKIKCWNCCPYICRICVVVNLTEETEKNMKDVRRSVPT